MFARLGRHVRQQYAGFLALFIALGGVSYAAATLPANSVGSSQIKNGQIKTADLANNAVTSPKVKDGSLLSADFKPGELPAGAPGATGATGATGPKGDTGLQGLKGDKGDACLSSDPACRGPRGDACLSSDPACRGTNGTNATKLFAAVTGQGTLVRGNGVVAVTRLTPGSYLVRFNQNITNCAYLATAGTTATSGVTAPADVSVGGYSTGGDVVAVRVETPDGAAPLDAPFYLGVFC